MIVWFKDWYGVRTSRERRLIQLMAAIAAPLLLWLLLVIPLGNAYDDALQRHLQAVDRNARVKALAADTARRRATIPAAVPDLSLFVIDSARQRGMTAEAQGGALPGTAAISIATANVPVALDWLRTLEEQGYRTSDLRIEPTGDGSVAVSATVAGGAQ